MKLTLALLLATGICACDQANPVTPENHGAESAGEHGGQQEGSGSGEPGESGTRYNLADTAQETRSGIRLVMRYDAAAEQFSGTVNNTTTASVDNVRVEVHLSNGTEIGPSPRQTLSAGQTSPVVLAAGGEQFSSWSVHVEIGAGEH